MELEELEELVLELEELKLAAMELVVQMKALVEVWN